MQIFPNSDLQWLTGVGLLVNSARFLSTVSLIYEKFISTVCLSKAFNHIETHKTWSKCGEKLFKSAIIM